MLLTIAALLFIAWIVLLALHVTVGFIHILIVAAIIFAIWHFIGRRHHA
ncbi:MAG TPA: DUF5670 family protein [Candidatus Saccharimonadales bacterium]|nr:DUF5670 family protein [Candidatus Saccharimonadales bacterium]